MQINKIRQAIISGEEFQYGWFKYPMMVELGLRRGLIDVDEYFVEICNSVSVHTLRELNICFTEAAVCAANENGVPEMVPEFAEFFNFGGEPQYEEYGDIIHYLECTDCNIYIHYVDLSAVKKSLEKNPSDIDRFIEVVMYSTLYINNKKMLINLARSIDKNI